jgi:hypothetical protein
LSGQARVGAKNILSVEAEPQRLRLCKSKSAALEYRAEPGIGLGARGCENMPTNDPNVARLCESLDETEQCREYAFTTPVDMPDLGSQDIIVEAQR